MSSYVHGYPLMKAEDGEPYEWEGIFYVMVDAW